MDASLGVAWRGGAEGDEVEFFLLGGAERAVGALPFTRGVVAVAVALALAFDGVIETFPPEVPADILGALLGAWLGGRVDGALPESYSETVGDETGDAVLLLEVIDGSLA